MRVVKFTTLHQIRYREIVKRYPGILFQMAGHKKFLSPDSIDELV